ncbi:MAG: carbon-nitrogen hydrolase [Phycisphaeraceae bacterium]
MGAQTMKIALLQHACSMDKDANVALMGEMAREAAGKGAKLIVTQELFATRYFCQAEDDRCFGLAEPIPGPASRKVCELAKELGVWISASLFERRAAGIYHNTSIMASPAGEIAGKYRKMHIPDDPRFYEKYYFTPGDLGFRAQDLGAVKTGMLICWDQWYPEAARLTAMRGAEVLLYPTAIGWYTRTSADGGAGTHGETETTRRQQLAAWRTMQRSHAIANGVYVAAVNRVGVEGELKFWGHSFIVEPSGDVIAEAGGEEREILIAEMDRRKIEEQRLGWPFFRDRRIDAYGDLTKRYSEGDV